MADKSIVNNKEGVPIFYIMGVSGSGKSTIGKLLSQELAIPFFDGDDFHSKVNVQKMASGVPLNDEDRLGWLETLNQLAIKNREHGAIIACSALKENYRMILAADLGEKVVWVYLKGSFEEISTFLAGRKGHYMPPTLLQSQLDILEEPNDAICISINSTPENIVATILKTYTNEPKKPLKSQFEWLLIYFIKFLIPVL